MLNDHHGTLSLSWSKENYWNLKEKIEIKIKTEREIIIYRKMSEIRGIFDFTRKRAYFQNKTSAG